MHFGQSPATVTITLFENGEQPWGPQPCGSIGAGHLSKVLADMFPGIAASAG